jgi:hypothetical protein
MREIGRGPWAIQQVRRRHVEMGANVAVVIEPLVGNGRVQWRHKRPSILY